MGKKINSDYALRQAAKALVDAARVAKSRGEAENLANISLTWMELSGKLKASDAETDSKKIGFHHDGE